MAKRRTSDGGAINAAAEIAGRTLGRVAHTIDALKAEHPHPLTEARDAIAAGSEKITSLASQAGARANAAAKRTKVAARKTSNAAAQARRRGGKLVSKAARATSKAASRTSTAASRTTASARKSATLAVRRVKKTVSTAASRAKRVTGKR